MEIVQKKKSNKHTFSFKDNHFNFAYQDKTGSEDVDINYAEFPQKSSIRIEQNEWLRNVGILWCVIGLFQIGYAVYLEAPLTGKGFWLIIGLACIAWAYFSTVKYSVFKSDQGSVYVIQGKNHDTIIDEINSRRKTQLLDWYGEVNPENNLENEIGKFRWLADQNVISKEESEEKIAQVELLHSHDSGYSGNRLN